MKRSILTILLIVIVTTMAFAGGNGNGGKDKIGVYLGWPFGLSYSHEFSNFIELDILFGYSGFWNTHILDLQAGALFTVFDPAIPAFGNQNCPLTVGPVLGGSLWLAGGYGVYGGSFQILGALRWEMNFASVPDLNLFFDVAPVGISINFYRYSDWTTTELNNSLRVTVGYAFRSGFGIRYRIP